MEKFIRFAIALIFLLVVEQAVAGSFPVLPVIPSNESLIIRAQGFQIQLGVSDGLILSVLSRNGYSDIRITKKKLTKARAEGCKDGIRYDVEIGSNGRIRKAKQIGTCRPVINADIARWILRQKGFRQIQLSPESSGFVAAACRGPRRFRVSMNQFGDMGSENVLGRCGGVLSQYDIAALLRAQGFSRISVTQGRRGTYSVIACRGDNRVQLLVGNDGAIVREQRSGRCDPPIHPATIPAILSRYSFTRIDVIDRQLPRYVAQVCRDTQRLEISLNRYGEIVDERSIGRCEPPMNAAALDSRLREIGYDTVRIVADNPGGFVAEVCEDGARFQLELTRYGETTSEKSLGDCASRRVRGILKQLEKEGMSDVTVYVDGCRKRKRYRIVLDEYGSMVSRNVIGQCK